MLNKGLAADEGARWRKWPRVAILTVDEYVGDDALQEASTNFVNWRTDIETFAERVFAGTAVPTFDGIDRPIYWRIIKEDDEGAFVPAIDNHKQS